MTGAAPAGDGPAGWPVTSPPVPAGRPWPVTTRPAMARDEVDQVDGRAVLVTGAGRGIGAAVAQAFADQGDRVAVHYGRSAGPAADVLAALPGGGHLMIQADLADPDAVRRMVDQAVDGLGGLDVLVNNAGVYERAAGHRGDLRAVAGGLAAHAGGEPHRRRERDLVRGPAHDRGRRRPDHQRVFPRRVPRASPTTRPTRRVRPG